MIAILERIDEYRTVLESYSARLLPCVKWEPAPRGNVTAPDDTADFYRFFAATPHAEFLYGDARGTPSSTRSGREKANSQSSGIKR
ncbi:hypothetical protein [Bradyrhizobium sp.]|uniref:hypothetical protein n=1 Tax=Bradyrhizobium sp. TaxID=376 RepID=UPI003C5310A6